MQGRLATSPCRVRIDSRCALCARPLRIDVDQDLRWSTPDTGAGPLIMEPFVDWSRFAAPTILHAY